jgi:cytochrome c553
MWKCLIMTCKSVSQNRQAKRHTASTALAALAALTLAICTATTAIAQTSASSGAIQLSHATEACAACHGANGISVSDSVPNLAGQKASYLLSQLRAFKSRERKHDVMNAIASQLSESNIAALAKHFSTLTSNPNEAVSRTSPLLPNFVPGNVAIPDNYRTTFTRYLVMDDAAAKTTTSYYANSVAIDAARANAPLPTGAIIVAENGKAKVAADGKAIVDENKRLVLDRVTALAVMVQERGWGEKIPELLRNGDWRFALLTPDRREMAGQNYAECFACHLPLKNSNFLFTNTDLYAGNGSRK